MFAPIVLDEPHARGSELERKFLFSFCLPNGGERSYTATSALACGGATALTSILKSVYMDVQRGVPGVTLRRGLGASELRTAMRTTRSRASASGAVLQQSSSRQCGVSSFFRPVARASLYLSGCLGALLVLVLFFCLFDSANGQAIKFTDLVVPASESLRHHPHPFYIFGSNVVFAFPKEAIGKHNTVTIRNLRLSRSSTQEIQQVIVQDVNARRAGNSPQAKLLNTSPAGIEVALFKYRHLKRMLTESSPMPFCCHGMPFSTEQPFVPTAECPYPNALRRFFWSNKKVLPTGPPQPPQPVEPGQVPTYDGEEVYVRPVALAGTPEAEQETTFVVRDSDVYVFVTANCGPLSDLTYDGEIEVSNAYGKLPGYAYSGFVCVLICVVAYALLTLVWGCCLLRQKKNLIPFHYCLGGVALLCLLESAAELWNLYHWNFYGPSKLLFCLSIGLWVLKNISAYVLVLLGALGWSITRPSLEKGTVYKIQVIVITYIVFDSLRYVVIAVSHLSLADYLTDGRCIRCSGCRSLLSYHSDGRCARELWYDFFIASALRCRRCSLLCTGRSPMYTTAQAPFRSFEASLCCFQSAS